MGESGLGKESKVQFFIAILMTLPDLVKTQALMIPRGVHIYACLIS